MIHLLAWSALLLLRLTQYLWVFFFFVVVTLQQYLILRSFVAIECRTKVVETESFYLLRPMKEDLWSTSCTIGSSSFCWNQPLRHFRRIMMILLRHVRVLLALINPTNRQSRSQSMVCGSIYYLEFAGQGHKRSTKQLLESPVPITVQRALLESRGAFQIRYKPTEYQGEVNKFYFLCQDGPSRRSSILW